MSRSFFASALALCVLGGTVAAQSQSLPNNLLTVEASSSSSFPFNTAAASHKWQWVYDSSQFVLQAPQLITQIYVRSNANAAVAAFNFPSVRIVMASSPNNYGVGTPPAGQDTIFANNLFTDQLEVRAATPWTGGPVPPAAVGPATFFSLGITTPFLYDPTQGRDLVIQLEVCGATTTWGAAIDGQTGAAGAVGGNRYGNTTAGTGCSAASRNFNNNEFVPVVKIDYAPANVPPQYQVNQAGSSLDLDGSTSAAFNPMTASRCVGANATLNLGSSSSLPWDLGLTIGASLVPVSGGAITTGSGQIVNLNLVHPSLTFLNGLAFAFPFAPLSLPFSVPALPSIQAQMVNLSASNPDGFTLSAGLDLSATGGTGIAFPVAGPTTDDSAVSITVGGNTPPSCANLGIPFYGVVRSTIHVISNGRVCFDTADTDFSPTAAEAQTRTFIGAWMDLNPGTAGSGQIDVTNPAPGIVSVNYNGVWHFGATSAANSVTYQIVFDTISGAIAMNGLSGILPGTASAEFLGMSPGGAATDLGATPFTIGGTILGTGNQMIYELNAAIATPAVNTLTCIPNMNGNYDVIGS